MCANPVSSPTGKPFPPDGGDPIPATRRKGAVMLNPFKLLAIYGVLNKIAKQAKRMTMQNWKATLFGVLAGGLLAVGNYNGVNTLQGYAAAIAVALLGA